MGSGKDTVAEMLCKDHGFHRLAFADALKDGVAAIFQYPREMLEGNTPESREWREKEDPWWSERFGYKVTPRILLQKMGTEAGRNGISLQLWTAALEKRIGDKENVVITDVRFPNELLFLKHKKAFAIRIKRGRDPTKEDLLKMHISETAIDNYNFDYTLYNVGTLNDLQGSIDDMLTVLKSRVKIDI